MRILICFMISFYTFYSHAQVYRGENSTLVDLNQLAHEVTQGSIVVIGEEHGKQPIADGQFAILNSLALDYGNRKNIDVGMEFLNYPDQNSVDQYLQNQMNEVDFLKAVNWGTINFNFYKRQILFPDFSIGGRTWALNAPRFLTGKIAKQSLDSLTDDEKKLLPPHLTMGNDNYKARFEEMMANHVPKDAMIRYFQAQSVWDDTMAWKVAQADPHKTLVIIVGGFHVDFGGGLPDRIRARNPGRKVITISQISISADMSETEKQQVIQPDPKWGIRGDYLQLVH